MPLSVPPTSNRSERTRQPVRQLSRKRSQYKPSQQMGDLSSDSFGDTLAQVGDSKRCVLAVWPGGPPEWQRCADARTRMLDQVRVLIDCFDAKLRDAGCTMPKKSKS